MPGTADEVGAAEAEYWPLLFSIAYGITGSVGDAEDSVQHAFLGLTGACRAGTTIADPKAYLTTTVTRLGINHLHSARMRSRPSMLWSIPTALVISDRCLMWRDCRRRNYRNTDTTDEGGTDE